MERMVNGSGLVMWLVMLAGCASHNTAPNVAMPIQEIGSFHVGGRSAELRGLPKKEVRFTPTQPPTVIDPNGEFEVEQMYAQFTLLADSAKRAAYPLVMIHGGGLSGVTWETKPDGKPGWQMFFYAMAMTCMWWMRWSVAELRGRGIQRCSSRSQFFEPKKRRGSCFDSGRPMARVEGRKRRMQTRNFQWRILTNS